MRGAPFSRDRHPAAKWAEMGYDIVGEPHPSRAGETLEADTMLTSMEAHAAKRVKEKRWQSGTSATQYADDLRRAVSDGGAKLCVGEVPSERSRATAATLTPVQPDGAPAQHLQPGPPGRKIVVFYSAREGALCSGYTVRTAVEERVLWKGWKHWRAVGR